jgi:hypothetical protein
MRTHLFDDVKEDWTPLATDYSNEIEAAILPIIKKAKADGVSLRDLHVVIDATTLDLILSQILG